MFFGPAKHIGDNGAVGRQSSISGSIHSLNTYIYIYIYMGVSFLFLVVNRAFFLPCFNLCRSLGADDGGCVLLRIDSAGLSVAPSLFVHAFCFSSFFSFLCFLPLFRCLLFGRAG